MKSVGIIGGGISGLCTGILACLKGYEVTIFEKNKYLGGGYKASVDYGFSNNYIFIGSKEGKDKNIREKLEKIVKLDNIELLQTEYIYSYKLVDEELFLYSDLKRLEEHLLKISPFDKKSIDFLIEGFELVGNIDFSFEKSKVTFFKSNNTKNIEKLFNKYGKVTIGEFCNKLNSNLIRNALNNFINPLDSLVKLVLIVGLYTSNRLLYVKNKEDVLNYLIDRYINLNGKIEYNCFVNRVDLDNSIIYTENDKKKFDYIINCSDIYYFNTKLLNNKNINNNNKFFFENSDTNKVNSLFVIEYNVSGLDLNHYFSWKSDKLFRVGSKENNNFKVFVRDDKLSVMFKQDDDDFEFFKILSKNSSVYRLEINRIIDDVTDMLKGYFDNLEGVKKIKLKFDKCITPYKFYEDYSMYKGSINGFKISPKAIGASLNGEIKNYNNVFSINGDLMQPYWLFSCFLVAINNVNKYLIDEKGKEE